MPPIHAVVWIDHHAARIIGLTATHAHTTTVTPATPVRKLHQKRGVVGSGHPGTDPHFFDDVATALTGVERILLTGPGSAKDELADRLRSHHPAVGAHVLAAETVDHPSDAQLVEHARRRFRALDQLDGLAPQLEPTAADPE